jgi:hypothetical protein
MDRRERLDDPEESLRMALDGHQATVWTALPGIVSAVDLAKQTVSVQPAIQGQVAAADGSLKFVNLPLLVDVPITWPRAGGFALTFPIAIGDEVLVIFSSRCIDAWWQSGGVQPPAEHRMHDLSDGYAILAPTSQPKKLSGVSATNVQLRDAAGTTFVEIAPGGIVRITSVSEVNISTPLAKIVAQNIELTGAVKVVGDITHTGGLTTSGEIKAATVVGTIGITSGGKPFNTHTHGGVTTGAGTTGTPS